MASISRPNLDPDSPYRDDGCVPRSRSLPYASFTDHLTAAKALSAHLERLGIRHAYIGGFAWALLGSARPTEDIDVLIVNNNIRELRDKVMELDPRFADDRLKFYYVTEDVDEALDREERVRSSHNNVHIDTLPAGRLGLPVNIVSTFKAGEAAINVLHPTIMILTKFKRWSVSYTSSRPKTIKKTASDRSDIVFIIAWLDERKEQIRFHEYEGKTKPELLSMIRKYHDKYVEDVVHMDTLRRIMPDDWEDMLALPEPETENTFPPTVENTLPSEAQNTRLPAGENAIPLDVENTIPPVVENPLPT